MHALLVICSALQVHKTSIDERVSHCTMLGVAFLLTREHSKTFGPSKLETSIGGSQPGQRVFHVTPHSLHNVQTRTLRVIR